MELVFRFKISVTPISQLITPLFILKLSYMFLPSPRILCLFFEFFIENSCYFEFHSSYFFVKDNQTKKVLLTGPTHNGLYIFPSLSRSTSNSSSYLGERMSLTQWHKRLGHPSLGLVSCILRQYCLPTSSSDAAFFVMNVQ